MRFLLPLLLVAGCGSSSSSSDMQTSAGPDMATSSCSQTVAAYCAAVGNCKQDLATAMMASSWCPSGSSGVMVTLQHCAGSQTLIIATYTDSADHLVYAGGALVAVFTSVPHTNDLTCVAGPTTFAAPSGCDTATTLCP
jgi:hypothetical protein